MPFILGEDEQQIFIAQKHWFILVAELVPLSFIYIVLIAGLFGFIPKYTNSYFSDSRGLTLFMATFLTFIFWLFAWILWLDYHLDAWVITTKRIIDLNQKSIFMRDVTEIWLDKVQDVTLKVDGIIPSLLGFGTVRVQTASETKGFSLHGVANPYKVQEITFRALTAYKDSQKMDNNSV